MSIRNSRCPGGDSLTDDFATALAFLNLDANPTLSQQVLLRKHDETFHFDHLPSELISQIICCAIQAWGDQYNQDDRFIDTNPFHLATLRRVCQRWNQVALQTPELWRGLELDLDKLKSGHDFLGFANAWFDRAGERAPLRLTVAMEGAPSRDISSRTSVSKQLLSLMLRGGRNWEKLQLYGFSLTLLLRYGNNWFVPESLAPASKSELFKFPTLKTLSLQASCDYPMITPAMCCFGLFAAPNPMPGLKSLYIRSNTAGPGSFAFYPQNLRFLHLHGTMYFSPHNFAKFPALEEITFEFASLPSHLLEGPMGPLLLPSLRRLAIIEPVSVSLIEVILTTFRTPALQLLRFSGRNQWVQLLAEHCVERFFKESNATDLTLSLEDSGLSCAHEFLISKISIGIPVVEQLEAKKREFPVDISHLRTSDGLGKCKGKSGGIWRCFATFESCLLKQTDMGPLIAPASIRLLEKEALQKDNIIIAYAMHSDGSF
ncbi:hypothetical protein FA15DRAFT_658753 [Coprinopsis marcescibilis]|uniref:F-box domain-containing protein n=1 Tax=Coprinopsis marcescibilis TaxID=230819 RepID=A0A5C3KKP2_COPMA|nr:hypothetical protein FA15DRAFT_658753 [Coprinopsis marcescibilis]